MKSPQTKSRFAAAETDKLRGGYYTSGPVADWLCAWAIRTSSERVLEPSCGDGAFIEAAATRQSALRAPARGRASRLIGVEITPSEATRAQVRLSDAASVPAGTIIRGDFFSWYNDNPAARFDVVVGNPPFIRYQTFPEPHRTLAMEIMVELGLRPNKLTNIWVPFVAAAAARLNVGGRLALVLPAEILQVTYAAQLRAYLTARFARIDIVACNELFFEKAEQEVVLLLADGALPQPDPDNVCRVTMTEAKTVAEIVNRSPQAVLEGAEPKTVRHDSEKWLKFLLTESEITLMRRLRDAPEIASLSAHASVDVGVVTGKNEFFVLTQSQVTSLGLEGLTTPLISRSAHLRGAKLGKVDWRHLSAADDRVHLLDFKSHGGKKPSAALARYIKSGEAQAVHEGYKCSIRAPWYAVPSIWTPDGFMFRQIYDFPRIVLNQAGATSTDTIHRLTANTAKPERVIANTYTWLTAASAEIEGRSYGGGVLELEPTEAERLLMPAVLNGALPMAECDRLTRAGRLNEVLEENARIVLRGHLGLSQQDTLAVKGVFEKMRDRRLGRRRRGRAEASTSA